MLLKSSFWTLFKLFEEVEAGNLKKFSQIFENFLELFRTFVRFTLAGLAKRFQPLWGRFSRISSSIWSDDGVTKAVCKLSGHLSLVLSFIVRISNFEI